MSYLDVPRLYVTGTFFTDPSTVNNDSNHYKPDVTRPSPWQEPFGQHRFQFKDVKVSSALSATGPVDSDPVIGATVASTDHPSPAKIVDLDVCQQGTSSIYGLRIRIEVGGGALEGFVVRPDLNGVYFSRTQPTRGWNYEGDEFSFGKDAQATGTFQTLLNVYSWPPRGASPFLDALYDASAKTPGGIQILSFRFELDGYQNVSTDKFYQTGRIVGAIGPYYGGEPARTPGERWLEPRAFGGGTDPNWPWYWPFLYGAPFKVDGTRKKLVLDLSHAVSMTTFRGDPVDLGTVTAVIDPDGAATPIGTLALNGFQYSNNALILELDLDDAQLSALADKPLGLVTDRTDLGPPQLWKERADGINWAVDERVFRLSGEVGDSSAETTTKVYVRRFGKPLSGYQLIPEVVSVIATTPGNTSPNGVANTPQAEGAVSVSASPTDADGVSEVLMRVVRDPGQRTPQLDGQLYFIYLNDAAGRQPGDVNYEHQISLVAFSQYSAIATPQWSDVAALMEVYKKLFPAMTAKIDLTDQHAFSTFANNPPWCLEFGVPNDYIRHGMRAGAIPFLMTLDVNDPRYMPLTRDLSPNKVETVLNWIQQNQPPQPPNGYCSQSEGDTEKKA